MDIKLEYLSFFVVKVDGDADQASKTYRHYQTLDEQGYINSKLKWFLDGEFVRTIKKRVDRLPKSDHVSAKIGRFMVEPHYGLDSNPNYNLFQKLRQANSLQEFQSAGDDLLRSYISTSSIRGGALFVARVKISKYFDEPFVLVMKSDFENKIASIADEQELIQEVEMAISSKNMKSIQYPHMPEEGILEAWELKIIQSSHARYFEDFLKYVSYEASIPEMMNTQVMEMVQQHIDESYSENEEQKQKELEEIDLWVGKKERELQEKWNHEQVAQATQALTEVKPDLEMKFKLDGISIKTLLAEYGENIHFAKIGNRYVVLIEGDQFQFEKGISPIELLRPTQLEEVIDRIAKKQIIKGSLEAAVASSDEEPPF